MNDQYSKRFKPDFYFKRNFLQKLWYNIRFKKILTKFSRNPEIMLDEGCDSGIFLNIVSKNYRNIKTVGIDISRTFLRFGHEKFQKTMFVLGDITSLPFKKKSFDIVTCLETLEYTENPFEVITETHRVLNKNGKLILTTPNKFSSLWKLIFWLWDKWNKKLWSHFRLHNFTRYDLKKGMKKNNFKKVKIESCIANILLLGVGVKS